MSILEFSKELLSWAKVAGYALTPASITGDGRAIFWTDPGGEIRYFIAANQGGWLVVTSSERMGSEQFEVGVQSIFVLERYLFGQFGIDVRSKCRLPRVVKPHRVEEVYPGFGIEAMEFEGVTRDSLVDPGGNTLAIGDVYDMVLVSHYLNSTVAQIEESFHRPDGRPLFTVKAPRPVRPVPATSTREQSADVDELVGLVANDEFVNGVQEDVFAYRRSRVYPKPSIRRDDSWDGYVYFFYVGEGFRKSSGFRYDARSAAMPFSVPYGVTEPTAKQVDAVLARVRDAGNLPLERRWNAAVIVFDRASGRGDVRFFYGAEAEKWQMSPANADQIAAQGLALLRQVQGR